MYVCYHICHAMPSYHVIIYYTEFILSSIFICYIIYSVMYYCTLQVCHVKYVVCYMLCHVTKYFYLKLVMYFKLCSNYVMLRQGSSPFIFQSRFILSTFSLYRIHGATKTVEYVFNCILMCRIHGATTTVEYVFLMLSQVCVEYMVPQQLWSMYLHVEYMGPQQLWSMYFSC
ncbi:hypothetical protein I3843_13G115100 [Carya illinoinensis]|nr:hypothetical protein I3843_13G115100 [Carya illinoinensis]